jgi:hypothetical protein
MRQLVALLLLTATRAQTPVIPATCTEWFDGASFVVQRTKHNICVRALT